MEKLADFFGSFTLYDLFAYLLTGVPALAALLILGWSTLAPESALHIRTPSGYLITVAIAIAYVVGHVLQAVANLTLDRWARPTLPGTISVKVQARVRQEFGLGQEELKPGELQMYVRDLVFRGFQYKPPALRDIFEYRVGYYRGMTLGASILAVSLILRTLIDTTSVKLGDRVLAVSDALMWALVIFAVIAAAAHLFRFRRFQKLLDRFDALAILQPGAEAPPADEREEEEAVPRQRPR